MMKPLIVYVSGAPGSGKTTLAKLLAEHLHVPSISSDLMHGGVAFSDPMHNRKQTLHNVLVPTMIDLSQKGVSFVVDQVLQKGLSETDIINKLLPYAIIVNVHTVCKDPIKRYIDRIENSDIPSIVQRRQNLLGLAASHKDNLIRTFEPLELGLPSLVVNTDDGYKPSLEKIIAFIQNSRRDALL